MGETGETFDQIRSCATLLARGAAAEDAMDGRGVEEEEATDPTFEAEAKASGALDEEGVRKRRQAHQLEGAQQWRTTGHPGQNHPWSAAGSHQFQRPWCKSAGLNFEEFCQ